MLIKLTHFTFISTIPQHFIEKEKNKIKDIISKEERRKLHFLV